MLGVLKRFQQRKSGAAGLLEASRAGVERALEALPQAGLTDALLDLASHTGVDFGDLIERAIDRASDLATRASESASELVQGQTPHELAERARSRAAELAARAGAAGLSSAIAPKRRRSRLPLVVGLVAGVAAGALLAYFLAPKGAARRESLQQPPLEPTDGAAATETMVVVTGPAPAAGRPVRVTASRTPATRPTNPIRNAMDAIRQRYQLARAEARRTQDETARELWREYTEDVQHRIPANPPPPPSIPAASIAPAASPGLPPAGSSV